LRIGYRIKVFLSILLLLFFSHGCILEKHTVVSNFDDFVDRSVDSFSTSSISHYDLATRDFFFYLDSLYRFKQDFFSCRALVNFSVVDHNDSSLNEQRNNLKVSLKIQSDSVIHALMSVVGIPIFTTKITQDSLLLVNHRQKCFVSTDLASFLTEFSLSFSYTNLESLFLARPILMYDSTCYVDRIIEDSLERNYILYNDLVPDWEVRYIFSIDSGRLIRFHLKQGNLKFTVSYSKHTDFIIGDGRIVCIPKILNIEVFRPEKSLTLGITYDKFEFNIPKSLFINTPDFYESCR